MADPKDNESADRTVTSPAPERTDTNEKADDRATIVDPDGTEAVEAISEEQGRSESPPERRG